MESMWKIFIVMMAYRPSCEWYNLIILVNASIYDDCSIRVSQSFTD